MHNKILLPHNTIIITIQYNNALQDFQEARFMLMHPKLNKVALLTRELRGKASISIDSEAFVDLGIRLYEGFMNLLYNSAFSKSIASLNGTILCL